MTTQAIVPVDESGRRDWMTLVSNTIAKNQNLNSDELKLFAFVSDRLSLDPFRKEVYAIRYKGQVQFVVGLDGYLRRAIETGDYDGHDAIQYTGDGKNWTDVWLEDKPPAAAKVTVYRKGVRAGTPYVARWKTFARYFNGKLSETWEQMPDLMLGKCALVHALREAFPDSPFYQGLASLRSEGVNVDLDTGEITEALPEPQPQEQETPKPPQPQSRSQERRFEAQGATKANASTRFWSIANKHGSVWWEPILREHFSSTDFGLLDADEKLRAAELVEAEDAK